MKIPNSASSLHYGISAHDSLNVGLNINTKKIQTFRPDLYLNSFLSSSSHVDLPEFDTEELFKCIKELVKVDRDWIPE